LAKVIQTCFLDHSQIVLRLTSRVVEKKEIVSEDLIYDLMNFTIGSIKCFTQERADLQREAVKHGYVVLLAKALEKGLSFGKNDTKRSQMLVQITGALRNLANDDDSYSRMCKNKLMPKLFTVLERYRGGHKELMHNVSRLLSKVSLDQECSKAMIATRRLDFLTDLVSEWQSFTPFVQRIAFVLANLTTYFDEAREQLSSKPQLTRKILQVTIAYFERDQSLYEEAADSKQQFAVVEDTLVKLIRLVANLSTDE
jgi:hypothetical protein